MSNSNRNNSNLQSDIYSKIDKFEIEPGVEREEYESTERLANILDGYENKYQTDNLNQKDIDEIKILDNQEIEIEVDEDEILRVYNDELHMPKKKQSIEKDLRGYDIRRLEEEEERQQRRQQEEESRINKLQAEIEKLKTLVNPNNNDNPQRVAQDDELQFEAPVKNALNSSKNVSPLTPGVGAISATTLTPQELSRQELALAEEKRRQEEERRLAEQLRIKEERRQEKKRQLEEKKRLHELQKQEEEDRRREEEARLAEQKRIEEETRLAEQKRIEEEKRIAEQRRIEEEAREELRRQQEEIERQREALRKEQEEAQRLEFQRQQEEIERQREELRKQQEEIEKTQQLEAINPAQVEIIDPLMTADINDIFADFKQDIVEVDNDDYMESEEISFEPVKIKDVEEDSEQLLSVEEIQKLEQELVEEEDTADELQKELDLLANEIDVEEEVETLNPTTPTLADLSQFENEQQNSISNSLEDLDVPEVKVQSIDELKEENYINMDQYQQDPTLYNNVDPYQQTTANPYQQSVATPEVVANPYTKEKAVSSEVAYADDEARRRDKVATSYSADGSAPDPTVVPKKRKPFGIADIFLLLGFIILCALLVYLAYKNNYLGRIADTFKGLFS